MKAVIAREICACLLVQSTLGVAQSDGELMYRA